MRTKPQIISYFDNDCLLQMLNIASRQRLETFTELWPRWLLQYVNLMKPVQILPEQLHSTCGSKKLLCKSTRGGKKRGEKKEVMQLWW